MAAPKSRVLREVEVLARIHTKMAVETLARIAGETDYEQVPAAAQVSAANALLDRGWGRPQSTVVVEDQNHLMSDEDLQRHVEERLTVLASRAARVGSLRSDSGGGSAGDPPEKGSGKLPRVVH